MAEVTVLPSQNREWGFWGTIVHRSKAPGPAWDAAFRALLEGVVGLTPEGARLVLDARWGRHYADTVPDALVGDPVRLRRHLLDGLAGGFFPFLLDTLREGDLPFDLRRRVVEDPSDDPVDVAVLDIAQRHFGVETLRARGLDRLDFHSVSVKAMAEALREAFEAGVALDRAANL